jgi:hypothetical protein
MQFHANMVQIGRGLNWFRFYTEAVADQKLRRLPPAQRWLWVAVLTLARQSPEPGRLVIGGNVAATLQDVSDVAAIPMPDVEAGMAAFEAQGMVAREGDVWVVVNWGKRQYESDNTTERVARWREAKRAEKAPAARPYKKEGRNVAPTLQQRSGNVSRNVAVTPQNTETESESSSPKGEGAEAPPDAWQRELFEAFEARGLDRPDLERREGPAARDLVRKHGADLTADCWQAVQTGEYGDPNGYDLRKLSFTHLATTPRFVANYRDIRDGKSRAPQRANGKAPQYGMAAAKRAIERSRDRRDHLALPGN